MFALERSSTRILVLALLAVPFLRPLSLAAQDVYVSDVAEVLRFNGSTTEVVIPGTVENYYGDLAVDEFSRRLYVAGACSNCGTNYLGWQYLESPGGGTVAEGPSGARHHPTADPSTGHVYWAFKDGTVTSILRREPEGLEAETVLDSVAVEATLLSTAEVAGLELDPVRGLLYWAVTRFDTLNGLSCSIMSSGLDGSEVSEILADTSAISDISLHGPSGTIYWINSHEGTIERASMLDGSDRESIVAVSASSLDIDARSGKLYWTNSPQGSVQRSNLDGTSLETVVSGFVEPGGLAVVGLQPTDVGDDGFAGLTRVEATTTMTGVQFLLELRAAEHVQLQVFNVRGALVAQPVDRHLEAGPHRIAWDWADRRGVVAAAGVYLYRLRAGSHVSGGKVVHFR